MTERTRRKPDAERAPAEAKPAPAVDGPNGDDAERALGRAVVFGLPVVTVLAAIVVGLMSSVGSALLVIASGTLLGTIGLLWTSVRTLSGDAPLPVTLETAAGRTQDVDALAEQKRRVLRALKDIETEHELGKIDDADYEAVAMQYRQEAKALMREMDENAAPAMAEAEKLAREYLAARGLDGKNGAAPPAKAEPARLACAGCGVSNEPDAAFCKKCGAPVRASEPADLDAGDKDRDATS
jgi:hypothetical protein